MKINERDIRIKSFCSKGDHMKLVHEPDDGIEITHIPTGIKARATSRSLHSARNEAMKKLKQTLFNHEKAIKVIFLDVDGVLNSEYSFKQHRKNKNGEINYNIPYKKHVQLLADIVEQTGAKIVLSASARGSWSCFHFNELLNGIYPSGEFDVIGKHRGFVKNREAMK